MIHSSYINLNLIRYPQFSYNLICILLPKKQHSTVPIPIFIDKYNCYEIFLKKYGQVCVPT